MPRKTVNIDPEFPIHVSARSNNRDWFAIPTSEVWVIMERYLYFIKHAFSLDIHAFILMNNHFHLLVTAKKGNISSAMNYFLRETSRCIGRESNRINHVYGGSFHKSSIRSNLYFEHAYKYIYRNPIEANICTKVEDYPYSSLHSLLGFKKSVLPLCEDTLLFNDVDQAISWLNTAPNPEDVEAVRRALRKKVFAIGNPKGGKALKSRLLTNSF